MPKRIQVPTPTRAQVQKARAITAWYLARYHGAHDDPGTAKTFCSPEHVGHFAVTEAALRAGEPAALFRVLVATAMFQRLRDVLIKKILKGLSAEQVDELTSPVRLLELADGCGCTHTRSLEGLLGHCDLSKATENGRGVCTAAPDVVCALKQHTVQLKRYGHFGKMPTSLALALREAGAADLEQLRQRALAGAQNPLDAAQRLEAALSRAWRVSDKIAAMFLSMVTNPDLSPGLAPWTAGIDWTYFVVIDSNVDLFLRQVGYPGPWTYAARREFLAALSEQIILSRLKRGLHTYNPRLVQQALFVFMSMSNRRDLVRDCCHDGEEACRTCPSQLTRLCGLKSVPIAPHA